MKKNRWLIACSAVAIHISIGSAYAYSVFKNPLAQQLGWEDTEVTLAFTLAIFFLGLSAALFGRFIETYGPRTSAMIAALLFSLGLIGTGISVSAGSLIGFYLFYGCVGGISLGIGYLSPVSTLILWFPDRRGLATGIAVLGFGAGALIAGPVAARLIEAIGISQTFYVLGAAYFCIMVAGALYIVKPPLDFTPPRRPQADQSAAVKYSDPIQTTAKEALKTKRFWMLWFMMFINISAGITIISIASTIAQEKAGLSVAAAASMVGVMGLFNGGGRIGWATLSDYIGRPNVFMLFFIAQLAAFLILPGIHNPLLFQLVIFIVISMYGGGFACLPAFIGDMFGTKEFSAINGYLLTSWSMAGVFGPMVAASIYDRTGSYDMMFYVFAVFLLLAWIISVAVRINLRTVLRNVK